MIYPNFNTKSTTISSTPLPDPRDTDLTIARKTKGKDKYFVGGTTGEQAHRAVVKLDFLPAGKKYTATIYRDAKDANCYTNEQAYVIETKISLEDGPTGLQFRV